jgi:hypothetical protein
MICEICRIQRYTLHNRLRGTSVRNDGNRVLVICKAKIKLLDAITDRHTQNPLSAYGATTHPLLRTPNVIHHLLPASTLFACEERTRWARRCLHWLTWVRASDDGALMTCMRDARMGIKLIMTVFSPCSVNGTSAATKYELECAGSSGALTSSEVAPFDLSMPRPTSRDMTL